VLLDSLQPTVDVFARATGWKVEARGACKGELCVPLPSGALHDDTVDVALVAERLGMAVIDDVSTGRWAVGPESFSGTALSTVEAPDLELQTFDGAPFRLSALRGTRHVLVAWAPY
jgi:hypothetical protein